METFWINFSWYFRTHLLALIAKLSNKQLEESAVDTQKCYFNSFWSLSINFNLLNFEHKWESCEHLFEAIIYWWVCVQFGIQQNFLSHNPAFGFNQVNLKTVNKLSDNKIVTL